MYITPTLNCAGLSQLRRPISVGIAVAVRVLIVDDSAPFRQDLRLIITRHADWVVCGEAADGREAIEKNRQLNPDLIVMDLSMPRMSGMESANEILREFPDRRIALLTLHASHQLAKEAREARIRATLSKADTDHITDAIEAVLRGEEFIS